MDCLDINETDNFDICDDEVVENSESYKSLFECNSLPSILSETESSLARSQGTETIGTELQLNTDDLKKKLVIQVEEARRQVEQMDKLLEKQKQREEEVKRESHLLRQEIYNQLIEHGTGDRPLTTTESKNVSKYLALLNPNAEVTENTAEKFEQDDEPADDQTFIDDLSAELDPPVVSEMIKKYEEATSNSKKGKSHGTIVERNIQCAWELGGLLAMSNDERKRVQTLLKDINSPVDQHKSDPYIKKSNGDQMKRIDGKLREFSSERTLLDTKTTANSKLDERKQLEIINKKLANVQMEKRSLTNLLSACSKEESKSQSQD